MRTALGEAKLLGIADRCTLPDGTPLTLADDRKTSQKPCATPGQIVFITLPLPLPAVRPNARSRSHWPKTNAVKKMRAWAASCPQCAVLFMNPSVSAVVYLKTKRAWDRDNLTASCKAYLDGLTDAGYWADDSIVRWGSIEFDKNPKSPRVVLRIMEGAA